MRHPAAVTALALAAADCAVLTATRPSAGVQQVELCGLSLFDQSLVAALCVTNPNVALDFHRVAVAVDVTGMPLANGASKTAVRLPRSSTLVPFVAAATEVAPARNCSACCARAGSRIGCAVACSSRARWPSWCRSAARESLIWSPSGKTCWPTPRCWAARGLVGTGEAIVPDALQELSDLSVAIWLEDFNHA
jgi:hypothetical protein